MQCIKPDPDESLLFLLSKVMRHGSTMVAAITAMANLQGFAIAGEFVMEAGKGYEVCEALKKNLASLEGSREQLCLRQIHPSAKGLQIVTGKPLDRAQYTELFIGQMGVLAKRRGSAPEHQQFEQQWRKRLQKDISDGRAHMELIQADTNHDDRLETWFRFYTDAGPLPDPVCQVPRSDSLVFLMNQRGDGFDFARMKGLILRSVQVETNNPRPARQTAQALSILGKARKSCLELFNDTRDV